MLELIRNEIGLFFNKKNILLFLAGIIAIVPLYHFHYVKAFKDYPQARLAELQDNYKDIVIYAKAYQNRLERLRKEYPGHPDTEEAELMARVWNSYSSLEDTLMNDWKWPDRYQKDIREAEVMLDEQLSPVAEQKVEVGDTNLYRNTQRDWNERMLLIKAYEKSGKEIPIIRNIPSGGYVLNDGLSGVSIIFMLAVLLVLLWNYDSWSADFEQSTCRMLFTLPYTRKRIFFVRYLVRSALSVGGVILLFGELYLCGAIRFGTGLKEYVIINTKAFSRFGFFQTGWKALMGTDKAVSIGYAAVWKAILLFVFITVLIAFVHLISFGMRNQIGTLIILVSIVVVTVTYVLYPREYKDAGFQVFLYFQAGNALNGSLGTGLMPMLALLGGCLVLLLGTTALWFEKREI